MNDRYTNGLSPAVELILACAAGASPEALSRSAAALEADSSWDEFLQTAVSHRITSLVCRGLERIDAKTVPGEVMWRLRAHAASNALMSQRIVRELMDLLGVFRAHDVPVIVHKGPALSMMAYQDASIRKSLDLDLLVHEEDFSRAASALNRAGHAGAEFNGDTAVLRKLQANTIEFRATHGKPPVDLHWQITPNYLSLAPDPNLLWKRTLEIPLGAGTVTTLSLADSMLALAVHGAKHAWVSLHWLCDVAALLKSYPRSDWLGLLDEAQRLRARRMYLLAIALAHDLLDAPVPPPLLSAARGERGLAAVAKVAKRMLFAASGWRFAIEEEVFPLRAIDRTTDRLRYLRFHALVPTVRDWAAIPLPASLFAAYAVLRPLRVACMTGFEAVGGVCKAIHE